MLIGLLVLSTRLLTLLHEVMGHGFTALILGGKVLKIKVSLFGGGRVWADINNNHIVSRFLFSMSGIFVNFLTGAIPFVLYKRTIKLDIRWRIFWSLFAMASLVGALGYLVTGIYYDFGDPVSWTKQAPGWFMLCWIPLIVLTPFIAFYCTKLYIASQESLFPTKKFVDRFIMTTATLGIAMVVYGALFVSTNQSVSLAQAPKAAYNREKAGILEMYKRELFLKIREQNPDLSSEEIQAIVDSTPVSVDPDEVPVRFPIIPVFAFLCISGGLFALVGKPKYLPKYLDDAVLKLKTLDVLLICIAAIGVILILVCTKELTNLSNIFAWFTPLLSI